MKKLNIISIIIIAAYICYIIATRDKSDIDYSYSAQTAVRGDTVSHIKKLSESPDTVLNLKQYAVEKNSDGYDVTLYNKANKKVYSIHYDKEPWVKEISEDILEIGVTISSSDSHVFYFNKADSRVSPTYLNPRLIDNKYIAYMESSNELIFTDIFDEKTLYEKLERDFSSIADINMQSNGTILLEYYKGEIKFSDVLEITPPLENNPIWSETVVIDNKGYHLSFKRISRLLEYSDYIGAETAYCLSVSDNYDNILQEIRVDRLPIVFEEVYWLEDINNDDVLDVMLCTWYSEGIHLNSYSGLNIYVWNKAEAKYELKNLPDEDMQQPTWNKELGTIAMGVDGIKGWLVRNEKMYIMKGNEWELYAELIREINETSSDSENEEIILREILYENGEVIQNNIIEDRSWYDDEANIWYSYKNTGLCLYPVRTQWERNKTEGDWKYVRKQGDTE